MVIQSYDRRQFEEREYYKTIERHIAGQASNRVWLYTVDKALERERDSNEFKTEPIVRIIRWQARNIDDKKIWRQRSSYNVRSEEEWASTSEIVEAIKGTNMPGSSFVRIPQEELDKLHDEIDLKEKRLKKEKRKRVNLKEQIQNLREVNSAKMVELNSYKKRIKLMKNNIREYNNVLKNFNDLINENDTTETHVHNFLLDNNADWLFGLKYIELDSKVRFPPNTKKYNYEFDMMLKRYDEFWDLIELKGPNENLFDQRTRKRSKPNRKLSEAIGQVFTYLHICDRMKSKLVLKPRAYIIIGKTETDDIRERRIFASYLNNVRVWTYSDLYERGKKLLKYIKSPSII
ncbi:MAG: DUF4263 domain-containing protein [Thermoplasmata archaeon]